MAEGGGQNHLDVGGAELPGGGGGPRRVARLQRARRQQHARALPAQPARPTAEEGALLDQHGAELLVGWAERRVRTHRVHLEGHARRAARPVRLQHGGQPVGWGLQRPSEGLIEAAFAAAAKTAAVTMLAHRRHERPLLRRERLRQLARRAASGTAAVLAVADERRERAHACRHLGRLGNEGGVVKKVSCIEGCRQAGSGCAWRWEGCNHLGALRLDVPAQLAREHAQRGAVRRLRPRQRRVPLRLGRALERLARALPLARQVRLRAPEARLRHPKRACAGERDDV